ncbi:NAD(P)/FAD-dependent oxidoreductase [Pseudochelatococcus sp. B33]
MSELYRAKRLPKLAGPAAWDTILGPRHLFPSLNGRAVVDFAIIGGGFAGLSAARRLHQLAPGARIALIEAGEIARGSAGRNSGFMIDLPHELTSEDYAGDSSGSDRQIIALNRQAIAFAAEAVREYAIPQGYFRRDGKVNGAVSAHAHAQNLAYAKHLTTLNEASEMLDAQAMKELTGSAHYQSGLFTPGTVMLQPAGYIRGLMQGLSQHISIYENSPVTELVRLAQGWSVRTPGGQIDAGTVILANNGHLESFGLACGRLMHIFLFACMTEELSAEALRRMGGAECWGVTPSDPMGTTMRRISTTQGGNRIITRTMAQFLPDMETSPRQMEHAQRLMRKKFDARYPRLDSVKMEYSWSGHLCLTSNSVSVTGRLDDDLYAACVCNGLGTTRSTLTGIAAAETALGIESEVTRFLAAQPRPPRLPPAPLAKIGANLFIRWREWRAHNE